jgi:lysyl-tRNA synthetase class 2
MGKSMFIDIRDQSGRIQAYAQKNVLGDEQFHIFQHLDLGDFIGVNGTMFTTKTGEISVKLISFVILAKALRPPPAKYYGLEDTEIRYRQRYLDLIANPDVKDVMLKRSAIIHEIRAFFHSRGYVEVETPAMQAIPGGAAAQPFKTFHNALGCEFYLRIALELYHKRLLVGGIDKLFEIGKNFRNEGLSRRHNPEFTMLEAYCAFGDYATMMETVEQLVCEVAKKVRGTLIVNLQRHEKGVLETIKESNRYIFQLKQVLTATEAEIGKSAINFDLLLGELNAAETTFTLDVVWDCARKAVDLINSFLSNLRQVEIELLNKSNNLLNNLKEQKETLEYIISEAREINLKQPWRRAKYNDLVKEKAGADWFTVSVAERRQRAHDMGAEISKEFEDFEVTNAVFSKFIEPTLINPTFVTHLPKELVPLAKLSPDDPTTVEVFECCINGQEISPGYTEQNDPIAQRTTLEHQAGGEQQKLDEDFLIALEHGMPPAGGIGIGIDRLCMMLLGQESIRDVILFPQLKPK